jgi:catechol 2,3-dioxygenase-like lactoylglutathione lyase family enzyme
MTAPSPIRHITFDCRDPFALAAFWSAVTGWPVDAESEPQDDEVGVMAPEPLPMLLFIRVPEGKVVKNRVHLDIGPLERTRDEEVERLTGLGGRVLDDRRTPEGRGWIVMADPEGNEFCVETSDAERAAFTASS